MFQTTVYPDIAAGVVGELAFEGPLNAQPATINSADATLNVIGRAFTHTNTGGVIDGGIVTAGGTGIFAGILANPKVYANNGTAAGGSLAANMTLRNGEIGEFVQETPGIYVTLLTAANVGDTVVYDSATGELDAIAPTATPAGTFRYVPNAVVVRYSNTGANNLAVIALNGPMPVIVPVVP